MNKETLNFYYSWFDKFVSNFLSNDTDINYNLNYRKEHTLRVCKNIVAISQSIKLEEKELYLAEAIALLHDVGRFPQYVKYKTFNDRHSEDHAQLSIKVLKEQGLLSELQNTEEALILDSIEYHNKYKIPIGISDECMLYSKLIRDADKLDILDFLVKSYENTELISNLSLENFKESLEYNTSIINSILKNEMPALTDAKTTTDIRLLRISWVFDIYFEKSFEIIRENSYIERMFKGIPQTDDIKRVYEHVSSYIDSKIKCHPHGKWQV